MRMKAVQAWTTSCRAPSLWNWLAVALRMMISDVSPGLMLLAQSFDEVHQLPSLFEFGKDKVLFQLLVIVLDELANQIGWLGKRLRWDLFLGAQPLETFFVNQEDAVEYPVLAHQILGRGDFLLFFAFLILFVFVVVWARLQSGATKQG